MIKSALLISVALVAGTSLAGWESWLKSGLFRASFEQYETDQELSDIGAVNGTWGSPAVPEDAETWASPGPGSWQCMNFSTGDNGIVFTPESTGNRPLKTVMTTATMAGCEEYPDLPDNAKGAFAIYAPENGATNFVGWTAAGWTNLQSSLISPESNQWYDISMKFMQTDAVLRVQYCLKQQGQSDADYVTLHAEGDSNAVWFVAGGGQTEKIINRVELRGEGSFRHVTGSEPRRGLLIGLVPWREMFIDETVYHHSTGGWYAFDYDKKEWTTTPVVTGDSYAINVPDGENYASFRPLKESTGDVEVVEFAVRFLAPNDNDATPTNEVCALVRLVEEPFTPSQVTKVDLQYRFACLVDGGWHTNMTIQADVDADYTVEVSLDKKDNKVSYRVKEGRGGEAGSYVDLLASPASISINNPLFTFFGGVGKVYGIRSAGQTVK